MLENMQKLHPRGAANRGICVDAEGAMLGPDCVLVRSTPAGFCAIEYDAAIAVQKRAFGANADRDWLFRQCQRIADALDRGEIALAQIYGLRIPVGEIDDGQLRRIGNGNLAKAGFDPGESRLPKGNPHGGEWTTGGDAAVEAADLTSPSHLFVDTAVGTDAAGFAPSAGSQSTAPGTGSEGQSASSSTEPSISYRIIPPRTPATPPAQTEAPDNSGAPNTFDSPDVQTNRLPSTALISSYPMSRLLRIARKTQSSPHLASMPLAPITLSKISYSCSQRGVHRQR